MHEPVQTEESQQLSIFLFEYSISFLTVVDLVLLKVNTGILGLPLCEGQRPLRQDRKSEFLLALLLNTLLKR